jgi:hypothetical protein
LRRCWSCGKRGRAHALSQLSGEGITAAQNTAFASGTMFDALLIDQGAFWRGGEAADSNGVTFRDTPLVSKGPKIPPWVYQHQMPATAFNRNTPPNGYIDLRSAIYFVRAVTGDRDDDIGCFQGHTQLHALSIQGPALSVDGARVGPITFASEGRPQKPSPRKLPERWGVVNSQKQLGHFGLHPVGPKSEKIFLNCGSAGVRRSALGRE